MKLLNQNNTIKTLLLISQSQQIYSKIMSEVTDHGITLLRGTTEELNSVKDSIGELINESKRRKKRGLGDSFGIKELIIRQIAEQLDKKFRVHFNMEMGEQPARGAYNFEEMESQLVSTGLKKDAADYGVLPLPKSHYCRYRQPTEKDGDTDACCQGENKQCFTEAGCFCDESCYTKYGDCCTDHFVKCYQKLKLCLISIDDDKAKAEAESSEGSKGPKHISQKNADAYAKQIDDDQHFENLMMARKFGGFLSPTHLVMNECCGQRPYNSADEKDNKYPVCCAGELTWEPEGYTCGGMML